MKLLNETLDRRGDYVLHRYAVFDQFRWSTIEVYSISLLIWHIATDLIYYNELYDVYGDYDAPNSRIISKCLSDYMFYLFVFRLSMLPEGIDERSSNDTSADAVRFFKSRSFHIKSAACKKLLQEDFNVKQKKRGY
ncbi:hypothetical protein Dsin_014281 [Dipteronia sinensis]|uniref:Uncharacterized protein n=1 Tax=Dipteronia sinensis TaxID=43782 RepID=A0AAE0E9S9_9ROSI|nr:hypothetical protein Dsin_014281 [Dipteronia sinensis]